MKIYKIFLFLIFSFNCQSVWYRELPNKDLKNSNKYVGQWSKNTNPRSAINSSWHKNSWNEKINLQSDGSFIKTYESIDTIGKNQTEKLIEGKGSYFTNGNWILLKTENILNVEICNGEHQKKESKKIDSSLLYYYFKEENLIIPMIYDMGYNEKEFGVKDGITIPYDENNANFYTYIRIYSFKDFQSHAYLRVNK